MTNKDKIDVMNYVHRVLRVRQYGKHDRNVAKLVDSFNETQLRLVHDVMYLCEVTR